MYFILLILYLHAVISETGKVNEKEHWLKLQKKFLKLENLHQDSAYTEI